MDGILEELLRLENAKHEALIGIDARAYDENVREQMRIVAGYRQAGASATRVEPLLALAQLITLNTRLLQNLLATTPVFESLGYTANGRLPALSLVSRLSVEA
jgi:hypothetical protein